MPDSEPRPAPLVVDVPPTAPLVSPAPVACDELPTADTASPNGCATAAAGTSARLPDRKPESPDVSMSPPDWTSDWLVANAAFLPPTPDTAAAKLCATGMACG